MEHVSATAAIDGSLLGTFAMRASFSPTMLLDRDYNWCAETMLKKYGLGALGRAEHVRGKCCKMASLAGTKSGPQ